MKEFVGKTINVVEIIGMVIGSQGIPIPTQIEKAEVILKKHVGENGTRELINTRLLQKIAEALPVEFGKRSLLKDESMCLPPNRVTGSIPRSNPV